MSNGDCKGSTNESIKKVSVYSTCSIEHIYRITFQKFFWGLKANIYLQNVSIKRVFSCDRMQVFTLKLDN